LLHGLILSNVSFAIEIPANHTLAIASKLWQKEFKKNVALKELEEMREKYRRLSISKYNTDIAEFREAHGLPVGEKEGPNKATSWEDLIIGGRESHKAIGRSMYASGLLMGLEDIVSRETNINLRDITKGKDVILLGSSLREAELVREICPFVKKIHIVNIDTEWLEGMAKSAFAQYGKEAVEKFAFYNKHITDLKDVIQNGSMAFAVCLGVLEFGSEEHTETAIAEIERMLMPGGVAFVNDIAPRRKELKQFLPNTVHLLSDMYTLNMFAFQKITAPEPTSNEAVVDGKTVTNVKYPRGINIGDIVILEGRKFLITDFGSHYKAGHGIGPDGLRDRHTQKYVKKSVEITSQGMRGKTYWLKLVSGETRKLPDKESQILQMLNKHRHKPWTNHFVQGITLKDTSGNLMNVIDNADGETLYDFVNATANLDIETYFQNNFLDLATQLLALAKSLKEFKKHTKKLHGDINHWHIILSGPEKKFVLIDYGDNIYDTTGLRTMLKFIALRKTYRFKSLDLSKTDFMPKKLVAMLAKCDIDNPKRYINNIDEFITDLEDLLNDMKISGERQEQLIPEAERIHAITFDDQVKLLKADEKKSIDFIALGTSALKGYEPGTEQHRALNPLISKLRNYCNERDIMFTCGNKTTVRKRIKKWKKDKKDNRNARGIVLDSEASLDELITELKELDRIDLETDENVLLAGVNNKNMDNDSYIHLMEMLSLTLEFLRKGKLNKEAIPEYLGFENKGSGRIHFAPTSPIDYDLKKVYELQADVLNKAA
jgi:hypothetical protein